MSAQVVQLETTSSPSKGTVSTIFKPLYSWYIPTSRFKAETAEKNILLAGNLRILSEKCHNTSGAEIKEPVTIEKPGAIIGNVHIADGHFIRTLLIKDKVSSDEITITVEEHSNNATSEKEWLVIGHGYGTALGFYFRNYEELSKIPNTNIIAIDWLGMGLSARPDFEINKKVDHKQRIRETEEFFIESLEKWRAKMGIEKMTLLGHSFGGYMSSLYALKYPERIKTLILESPVGVQETPEHLDEFLLTGDFSKLKDIPTTDIQSTDSSEADSEIRINSKRGRAEAFNRIKTLKPQYKFLIKRAVKSWNNYSSPQAIVRFSGRLGPKIINRYVSKFGSLSDDEKKLLSSYMYHISAQKGSSEHAMGVILKPMAFARQPLFNRIDKLKVPTVFMYGENDWMDSEAGSDVASRIEAPTKVYTITKAGHNMHLDNPDEFNKAIAEIMGYKF